jgi:hypothetical protein
MDKVMLASLLDELMKIATVNTAVSSAIGKPASVSSGISATKSIQAASKSPTKPTNYTVVHNQTPVAATGTADSSKAVPPPPVRA